MMEFPRNTAELDSDFWPDGMGEEERELVKRYELLRRDGEESSRKRVGECELNLAFLSGNQWVRYEYPSGLMEVENHADELRETDNRLFPTYLRWVADLFDHDPQIDVYEGGIELPDAEAAKAATLICDFWKANNGWGKARMKQACWMLVGSVGFVVPVWERFPFAPQRRRKSRKLLDEPRRSGGKLSYLIEEDRLEAVGDVSFRFYHPLQTYLFPLGATCWEDVTRVMVATVEDEDWMRDHAGDRDLSEFAPLKAETVFSEALDRVNRFVSPEFGLAFRPERGRRYLVLRVWENPTRSHPRGRYLELAGNRVLVDQELPYIDEAQDIDPLNADNLWMGVVPQFSGIFPGRLYPPAPVTMARPGQVRINEIATDAKQNRAANRNNKLLYEEGSIDDDAWSDERAEMIAVKPGSTFAPVWNQAPPLAGLNDDRNAAEYAYTEMTGQTEASRGQNPTYVRSAQHFSLAESQGQKVIHMMASCAEWSFEKQARLAMAIAKRRYSLDDLIRIVGKDRTMYAVSFGGSCIRTDLRVKQGSGITRNHYWRTQELKEFLQFGGFDDAKINPEGRRLYLEQAELGTMQSLRDEDMQRQKQQDENVRMAVYMTPVAVALADDHDIHIAELKRFMSRREFWDRLPVSLQALIETHLEEHVSARGAQLDPAASMGMEPVAGMGLGGASFETQSAGDPALAMQEMA